MYSSGRRGRTRNAIGPQGRVGSTPTISVITINRVETEWRSSRKTIKESFLKLLTEYPLSQITVKEIVEDCGINRNTFYYYFQNIPDLIEDIVMEDAEIIIQRYPTVEKIEDCLDDVIELALSKKRVVLHIYNSVSREIYEQYLWKVCDHVIEAYINSALKGRKISDSDFQLIKQYMSSVGFGIISAWCRTGMTEDIRGAFARMCEIKKGTIEEMLSRCEIG